MARRIIDLSLDIEDNMPSHKLFQSPVYLKAMTHENTKALELGTPDDPITFQTNFISTFGGAERISPWTPEPIYTTQNLLGTIPSPQQSFIILSPSTIKTK